MIPILYEGTETSFTSNGIGRLSDAISCTVTENRNGAYELEMEYPIDGVHFSDISLGKYIFAKPAKYSNKQAFEIYQITRPINGVCTIYAYHISYRLSKIPVMPFSTNSVTAALSGLVTNAAETNPFTFTTTKTTVANYNQTEPRDARSCLGGVQGSILDVFGGGDYEFDMFNVKLWQNRGQDRGFQIRYGKNLTDIKQEESIEDTITGIVPFYKNESTTITLPEKVISTASASNFPYPRTIPVDLSYEFQDSVPTVTQLRNAGNAYIASHSIGVPKVSLDVSFVNLADMVGYEDIAILEDVRLCDTVTVIFEKLGVSASAKVVSTEWDVLKDKFNKVGLGSTSNSLANKIANIEKVQTESPSFLKDAIQRATNLITGESGGYVVIHNNSEGKPYEILIMDNEDIDQAVHVWRWNQAGWGYSSTGYNGTYTLAATLDGGIVADFIKAGTITGIAINNGNGTFSVDSSGNVTATSATITGTVNATGGTFSGNIAASGTISGGTISGATIDNGNGTFHVDSAGNVTSKHLTVEDIYTTANVNIEPGATDHGLWVNGRITAREHLYSYGWPIFGSVTYGYPHVMSFDTLNGYLRPMNDADAGWQYLCYLGSPDYRWNAVYSKNGVITTSDRNRKNNITPLEQKYLALFDLLNPVTFKFNSGDRKHVGFISQDVEGAMEEVGLNATEFAGFCKDVQKEFNEETQTYDPVLDENGNEQYLYSLRYSEFIALNTAKIKQLEAEVELLKQEVQLLKGEINDLRK